jgi:hypothetical protein
MLPINRSQKAFAVGGQLHGMVTLPILRLKSFILIIH